MNLNIFFSDVFYTVSHEDWKQDYIMVTSPFQDQSSLKGNSFPRKFFLFLKQLYFMFPLLFFWVYEIYIVKEKTVTDRSGAPKSDFWIKLQHPKDKF